ncbi:MAG: hypothetical protein ACYSW8_29195 [Planctomycetota bacterium]|jgi:hypothetical protein
MANDVESVFVIATSRGTYPVLDLFNSIRWSCQKPHYVVIVDRVGDVKFPDDVTEGYAILRVEQVPETKDGFLAGAGVRWAIDKGITCKQYVLLDDACLVLQPALDSWSLEHLQKTGVGLLGVIDRLNYEDAFARCAPWMDLWNMPHAGFEPGPHSVHEAALFLSAAAASQLYQQNLLVPEGCGQWPIPYGPFISWAVQMHGQYMIGWGHMDKQMPPLFVGHSGRARFLPAPYILSTKFGLYYSLRSVISYSEEDLREAFKRMRGEVAKPITPYQPMVFPRQDGPAVMG